MCIYAAAPNNVFKFERFPLQSVDGPSHPLYSAISKAMNIETLSAEKLKEKLVAEDVSHLSAFIRANVSTSCTSVVHPSNIVNAIHKRNPERRDLHDEESRPYVIFDDKEIAGIVLIGYMGHLNYFEVLPAKDYHRPTVFTKLVMATLHALFEEMIEAHQDVCTRTYANVHDGTDHTSDLIGAGWASKTTQTQEDPIIKRIIQGDSKKVAEEGYVWVADINHGGQSVRKHLVFTMNSGPSPKARKSPLDFILDNVSKTRSGSFAGSLAGSFHSPVQDSLAYSPPHLGKSTISPPNSTASQQLPSTSSLDKASPTPLNAKKTTSSLK